MAEEKKDDAKFEHKLTPEEEKLRNAKSNAKIAFGMGYIINIVGLILDKISPIVSVVMAIVGFLIARISGIFKKRSTLAMIELTSVGAERLQNAMDEEDEGKSEKRTDSLTIAAVAGDSPIGTKNLENSYLIMLFFSGVAQAIATGFSSLIIQKGEKYSIGALTPEGLQYVVIALSIVAIILPDILNYFEEKNQEKKLESYKWRLSTLQVLKYLEPQQVDKVAQDISQSQGKSPPVVAPPVPSVSKPPEGVGVIPIPPEYGASTKPKPDVVANVAPRASLSAPHSAAAFMRPPPGQTSSGAAPPQLPNVPMPGDDTKPR